MSRLTRRVLLGLGVGAGIAAAEAASFRGAFDHRHRAGASAPDRYRRTLEGLIARPHDGVVHISHSTHLLCVGGRRLLTDPWFHDPAFGAMSHAVAPAVHPEHIGPLDAVLITHDHADHADPKALDRLDKRARAVVSTQALAARVRALGFRDVEVLRPWQTMDVGGVRLTAVPALHDIYEIGFVTESSAGALYFAGDTHLHPDLPAIAERFRPAMAILPVDGTRLVGGTQWVMRPEDAVTAARTLGIRAAMPTHAEAYFSDPVAEHILSSHVEQAPQVFRRAMAAALPAVRCDVPEPGEFVPMPRG